MKSRWVVRVGLALALLAAALPAAAQDPEQGCFDKGGVWNADEQRCIIGMAIQIDIDYPLDLALAYPVVEQAADSFLERERAAFLAPIADPEFVSYSPGPLTLDVQYETASFSPDHLSLSFVVYTFTGGAHGMTYFETFTFDLANGVELSLDDLFVPDAAYLEVIAPLAQAALAEQLGEMADADWIAEGTAPVPENYQNWMLTPGALVFTFEQYQVAAYAAGPQTVTIPLSDVQDILAPAFAPASAQ